VPIDEHLVATVQDEHEAESSAAAPADVSTEAPGEDESEAAAAAVAVEEAPAAAPTPTSELERFKSALKALVQQGTMSRDEARAAWQTRLKSLQPKG
jgi:cell division septation protein DedD